MLVIHTRSQKLLSIENIKWKVKRLINKQGGPYSVLLSIMRGLDELDIKYKINKSPNKGDTLIALSGKIALREAIKLKELGTLEKLIVGPNIHVFPSDDNYAICDKSIDIILVPSEWTFGVWSTLAPNIKDKLRIWPAGVSMKDRSTKKGRPIIYNKLYENFTASSIAQKLDNPIIFNYGHFKQADFFDSLKLAPFMIYLSRSESQGLAIQEAWANNVPTLVKKSDGYFSDKINWTTDPKINAPYMNDNLGYFFENTEDLPALIENAKQLNPIEYCKEHLSDKACAQILLSIISQI